MRRNSRTTLIVVVALGIGACTRAPESSAQARAVREALHDELSSVALKNCAFKRYGGANDGGYLLCENLLTGTQAAYSYGIGGEDNWGCQVSRELGVTVHQYDCFTRARPTCENGRFQFHDECVGATRETNDSREFDTIAAQVAANGDAGKRLLVKMDVEGAEWSALAATPDGLLDSIDQLAMELHGTDESRIVDVIRRLKTKFYLVNLHFNNWSCTPDTDPLPAPAYQVLWVNKRVGVLDPAGTPPDPAIPPNAPDNPKGPDCQLTAFFRRHG